MRAPSSWSNLRVGNTLEVSTSSEDAKGEKVWGTSDPLLGLKSLRGRADFFVENLGGRDFSGGDFSPVLEGLLTDVDGVFMRGKRIWRPRRDLNPRSPP